MSQMQQIENELRKMILTLDLGPGERLTERWAEERFGASRTPIRAALLRLQSEGLVIREGRNWVVAPLDCAEISQLFVYRELLEVAAVRLIAKAPDAAALDDLEALLDACGSDATPDVAFAVGEEFHTRLGRLSGNEFIARGIADAVNRLARARWLESDPNHAGWSEHRKILRAIREQRVDDAVALISDHIISSDERIVSMLQSDRRSLRARGIFVVTG